MQVGLAKLRNNYPGIFLERLEKNMKISELE
jgi:hypothetical protein